MLVNLASIPALLTYFHDGKGVLGSWLAFFTFTATVVSFDLGVGNRLKNDILSKISKNGNYSELVRDAFRAQIIVSSILAILVVTGAVLIHWTLDATSEIGKIVQTYPYLVGYTVAFILLSGPLRLSFFILQAQQKNAASALVAFIPQLAVYCYAVFASGLKDSEPALSTLAAILLISNIIAYLSSFILSANIGKFVVSTYFHSKNLIAAKNVDFRKFKPGLPFFFVQVFIVFLYGSNEFFYLAIGTTIDIVNYQYYFRPFSLFSVGFSIISLPFWSAIRLSQLNSNTRRTRQLVGTIILLNIPVAIALLPTVYFYQHILDLWLGKGTFQSATSVLLIFAASSMLICIMNSLSSILSGYDLIQFQAKALGVGLLSKLACLFLLVSFGIQADPVMISTMVGLTIVVAIFSAMAIDLWRTKLSPKNVSQ